MAGTNQGSRKHPFLYRPAKYIIFFVNNVVPMMIIKNPLALRILLIETPTNIHYN